MNRAMLPKANELQTVVSFQDPTGSKMEKESTKSSGLLPYRLDFSKSFVLQTVLYVLYLPCVGGLSIIAG